MRRRIHALTVVAASVAIFAAAAKSDSDVSQRQAYVNEHGIPEPYASATRPADVPGDGADLYERHCESCHGATGKGDGESGAYFDPPPADLTQSARDPAVADNFLIWAIADGGKPISSGMNAFGKKLSEAEQWAVVDYLRSAFGE